MDNERGYTVYRHLFPNGKTYIGITRQTPEDRWQDGFGYQKNRKMFGDIVRFGWNNIEHQVLASGLSYGDAMAMERNLISGYGKDARSITYNTANAKRIEPEASPVESMWYCDVIEEAKLVKMIDNSWAKYYTSPREPAKIKYNINRIDLFDFAYVDLVYCLIQRTFLIPLNVRTTTKSVLRWLNKHPDPWFISHKEINI